MCQIQTFLHLPLHTAAHFLFACLLRLSAQIPLQQSKYSSRIDYLRCCAVARLKTCAQALMPSHQLLHAPLERTDVHLPIEPYRDGYVVGRSDQSKLIEKPQTLLCERERYVRSTLMSQQRR